MSVVRAPVGVDVRGAMVECPNCRSRTLQPDTKFFASELFPVACPACGKHAGIKGMFSGSYSAILEFVVLGAIFLGLGIKPTVAGTFMLLLFCAISVPLGAMQAMASVAAKETSAARLLAGVGTLLIVLWGGWAFFHD